MNASRIRTIVAGLATVLLLAGCNGSDDDVFASTVRYRVEVTNLTHAQPLSPLGVVLHDDGYSAFRIGETASTELERLAEGGDAGSLLAAADSDDAVEATAAGAGAVAPGATDSLEIETRVRSPKSLRLTVLSMLVNTNDAFTGARSVNVGELAKGEELELQGVSYDSGTEANSETADTIPGPAAAGGAQEGFSSDRDDVVDDVRMHGGVVTADDGLAGSVLTAANRWDNPVVRIVITRLE
ncbi:MAG: spondin domain-containing protein [Ectothiorhodospiraceae bacterium]|jgi:hypothetical protein